MSIFDKIRTSDLDDYLKRCANYRPDLNIPIIKNSVLQSLKNLQSTEIGNQCEKQWYKSIQAGTPDFTVYDSDFFIGDLWTCWTLFSRKYLISLIRSKLTNSTACIRDEIAPYIKTAVDLGCGFGYSTAGLKELFPSADIYGTNLEGGCQWKIASEIAAENNFTIVNSIQKIGMPIDLIFASEYFEHIERSLEHLEEIISLRPKFLIFANTFRKPAVGHFPKYLYRDETIPGDQMGRRFSRLLRNADYTAVKTGFWNNRPQVWKLI